MLWVQRERFATVSAAAAFGAIAVRAKRSDRLGILTIRTRKRNHEDI